MDFMTYTAEWPGIVPHLRSRAGVSTHLRDGSCTLRRTVRSPYAKPPSYRASRQGTNSAFDAANMPLLS